MKISIISPSFNQAKFLPFNLASVRSQKDVDVEHIIVDPGSTDGSTEIAKNSLGTILIAEPDQGQSDGICKGFRRSTGDILAWLNSDDFYPDEYVLATIVKCFEEHPEIDIVYGDVNFVGEQGEFLRKGFVNRKADELLTSFQYQVGIVQPGVFWRRRVFEEIGGPSDTFEYCMDYELWVRMSTKGYKWHYVPRVLAHHRWWSGMKTSSRRDLSLREHLKVCDRYFGYIHWKWLDRFAEYLCSNQDGVVNHAASTSISLEQKAKAICSVIDNSVTQEMLRQLSITSNVEQIATRQYIENYYPTKTRFYFEKSELQICSESCNDPKAQQRIAWNIFDVVTEDKKSLKAYHVPDNFDRYFNYEWHVEQIERSQAVLKLLNSKRRSDICVIVGNGPSLRKSNLSLLSNVDTIISNFAILSPELNKSAKILTVVNDLVAQQGSLDFNHSQIIKIVPFWLANYFNQNENTFFVNATVRPEFSKDFARTASWRSTVSFFNMQLAYAIGYKKVILIGFDHSYIQPKNVVEGLVINQVEDDVNHFDPRYFKGKDWQAADTDNMEKMYVLAKAAYEEAGREIVNCTVGGCLEVFRRGDLSKELETNTSVGAQKLSSSEEINTKVFPKLLMIDSTPVGHTSATGVLKQTFLEFWPAQAFLQIWENTGKYASLHAIQLNQTIKNSQSVPLTNEAIVEKCKAFQPDVIYFRPVDSIRLFEIAEKIVTELEKPLVIHMMDDWPERLRIANPETNNQLDIALRSLIRRSSKLLSICSAMSLAYSARYGGEWLPLANGVDLAESSHKDWKKRPPISVTSPFVVRYMGALASDMTYTSVKDIALAIAALQDEYPIRFEIYTMDWYRLDAEHEIGSIPGVSINSLVSSEKYKSFLSEADSLVIAYNFDPKSVTYTKLSLANKMPECLASGAPVLAYGPGEVSTIAYLKKIGCAKVVDVRSQELLRSAIKDLVSKFEYCEQLGLKARSFVRENLTKQSVQEQFHKVIRSAVSNPKSSSDSVLIGPFNRGQAAHYDETDCISELYNHTLQGNLMIDVGAHHGWALTPFLDKGWKIYAFEPDEENRAKLLERLAKHKNKSLVNVDIRCVSNKSQNEVAFYRSEQSTGISGLSAFHESHVEAQRVNTVTLMKFFQNRPLISVDFLKIDTEGHDLFVLKGFPWGRTKPRVVECEFEDAKTVPLGYTFHDLARFLLDKGYVVYVSEWHPIIRYGTRHDWHRLVRYPCNLVNEKSWGNLLAFREPIDENALVTAVKKFIKFGNVSATSIPQKVVPSVESSAVKESQAKSRNSTFKVLKTSHFTQVSLNKWRYQHVDKLTNHWQAVFDLSPNAKNRSFVANLSLRSSVSATLLVSLESDDCLEYEGQSQHVNLTAGVSKTLKMYQTFSQPHVASRVQISVLELEDSNTTDLIINSVILLETLESMRHHLAQKKLSIAYANHLLRTGDYLRALSSYLLLYRTYGLKMYSDNALMTARRLGIQSFSSADKLFEQLY